MIVRGRIDMKLSHLIYRNNEKLARYYSNHSSFSLLLKPIRKWITNSIAPLCPFNTIRIFYIEFVGLRLVRMFLLVCTAI